MSGSESSHPGPHDSQRSATPDVGLLSQRAIEAVEALCGRMPLDGADRDELEDAMRELRTVRSFYDTMDVLIARRSRQLAEAGKAGPAADSLAHNGRRSKREAAAATNREEVCDRLPGVENALAQGAVTSGHVDAIANATSSLTDEQRDRFDSHADELTERATTESVESFARHCYELARRVTRDEGESRLNAQRERNSLRYWVNNQTGMYHIRCELDPETGAKVVTALTAQLNTIKHRTHPTTPDGDAADVADPAPQPATAPAAATTNPTRTPTEPAATTTTTTEQPDPSGPAATGSASSSAPASAAPTSTAPTTVTEPTEPAPATPPPAEPASATTESTAPTGLFAREPAPSPVAPVANGPSPSSAAPSAPRRPLIESHPIEWLSALAFTELVTGAQSLDRRTPEVSVLIDLDTLINGLGHESCCETSTGTLLPPETIRRLACDGDLVPIVLGASGETLDVGRSSRLATPSQRRALRAMYSTCAHPGCHVPFDACEIHHVKEWKQYGPTDVANLLPLCGRHHHMVHEGGWKLALRSDRTIRLTRPDGTIHFQGTTINRRAREPAA